MTNIEKLVIQNFKKFDDRVFRFNQGTNIIVGDNESGKSTLLEAIEICLNCTIHGSPLKEELTVGLFNNNQVKEFMDNIKKGENIAPPTILIEAYIPGLPHEHYYGAQNYNTELATGVKVTIKLDYKDDDEFKKILKKIDPDVSNSLPVEYYKVEWESFRDVKIHEIGKPMPYIFVEPDTIHPAVDKNRYICKILEEKLDNEDLLDLNYTFRQNRYELDKKFNKINDNLDSNNEVTSKELKIKIDVNSTAVLEDNLQLMVDEIPFTYIGKGEKNQIQIKLSLHNIKEDKDVNVVLIDEIENQLSHMNLAKLIDYIENFQADRQLFITTHSSYVLNELSIDNLLLVGKEKHTPLKNLNENTKNKIKRLSGYDTLRIVLTDKAILVEGPSDELILKRYFREMFEKLPEDEGIEVIVVHGLRFKSYLDIANLIGTVTAVVVDNDGNFEKNVTERFEEYKNNSKIKVFSPRDENINTLEPSLIEANSSIAADLDNFAKIILPERSYNEFSRESKMETKRKFLEKFFLDNAKRKVDFAIDIFDSPDSIKYPNHLKEAIHHVKKSHP